VIFAHRMLIGTGEVKQHFTFGIEGRGRTTYGAVLVDLQLDVLVRNMRELDPDIAVRCSTLRKYDRGQHMYDASGQGKSEISPLQGC
jgi:hypothetical protein